MSVYAERARYLPVEQGFNIKRAPIEPRTFVAQMTRVFADDAVTGFTPLDMSETLGTASAATTPFMLTRYARVRKGESLACAFAASGEIWVVLRGAGHLEHGDETLEWCKNDIVALPGGVGSVWRAYEDTVLWVTTDEPTLAFAGVRPDIAARTPIDPTLYRAEDIARELRALYDRTLTPETPGRALFMATERTEGLGTCLPLMTLTLNAVRPGEAQPSHRHNAAAIALVLREAQCASMIGGKTFHWIRYATFLTPAGVEHGHCNGLKTCGNVRDDDIALALIVQDGGLYYYGRTMGFAFAE
jgi:gentisate 1,2-dioxygenase